MHPCGRRTSLVQHALWEALGVVSCSYLATQAEARVQPALRKQGEILKQGLELFPPLLSILHALELQFQGL